MDKRRFLKWLALSMFCFMNFVLPSLEPAINLPNPRKLGLCTKYFSGYIREDGESFSPTAYVTQDREWCLPLLMCMRCMHHSRQRIDYILL